MKEDRPIEVTNISQMPIHPNEKRDNQSRTSIPKDRGTTRNTNRQLFELNKEYRQREVIDSPERQIDRELQFDIRYRMSLPKDAGNQRNSNRELRSLRQEDKSIAVVCGR
jgi:hypothetical protein